MNNIHILAEFSRDDESDFLSDSTNDGSNFDSYSSFETTVPKYDDKEFKEHFRSERTSVNFIIDKIKASKFLPDHSYGRKKITAENAVHMTIWYLSNKETFRQISDKFDVTKSAAHRTIRLVVKYLVSVSKHYIKWPKEEVKPAIREGFKAMKGLDGVIGAIDGCHINIKRPNKDAYVYCNRKSDHSILLQGICDHKKRFIDIFCGEAGSIHDARLLKRSSIYEKAVLNGFLGNDVLLGDSAYPCTQWLIPPYKDNGNLTVNQKSFNYKHSATRVVIENAYGLLKGRFRRLRFFENNDIKFIVECVVAATVLHNICLTFNDNIEIDNDNDDEQELDEIPITNLSGIVAVSLNE